MKKIPREVFSKQRPDLLFKGQYYLGMEKTDETFTVKLKIPVK